MEEKKLKPIEFVYFLSGDFGLFGNPKPPSTWKHVDLVIKNYTLEGFDLMVGYDVDKHNGILYLGHYNDGVKQ